jgi:uncharacterized membrane protein
VALAILGCDDGDVSQSFFASLLGPRDTAISVTAPIAVCVVVLLAAIGWLPQLPASLGLDESLTYWVIEGGLIETLDRGVHFQSQAGYYVLLWLWAQVAGTSEIALRLPSTLAAIGACYGVARLGTALTRDREIGTIAAIIFASTTIAFREAPDARSYMPGLMLLIFLVLGVMRWTEGRRWRDAFLVGLLAGALPHFHLFLVLGYPAIVLYAALQFRENTPDLKQLMLICVLLVIGSILFIPAATTLLQNTTDYSFAPRPEWSDLLLIFAWPQAIAGLLAGFSIAGLMLSRPAKDQESGLASAFNVSRPVSWLVSLWTLVPLLLLFSISRWSDTSLFLSRYLIAAVPAVCLIYAFALRHIESDRARVFAVLVTVLAALSLQGRALDDMRGATAAVNEFIADEASTPVLFSSGLIETQSESWIRNPEAVEYLTAPTLYYSLKGQVVALPRDPASVRVSDEIIDPILRDADRFAAVEWATNGARIFPWLVQKAQAAGFHALGKPGFGGVRVVVFQRIRK